VKNDGEGGILGNILRGVGELVEWVQRMEAEGKTEISRTGTFGSIPERLRIGGCYGFNLKMGLPGKREQAAGGDTYTVVGQENSLKESEPVIEVYDEGRFVRVVAELPTVSDDEVALYMKENVLYIDVRAKDNPFNKSIVLPDRVKPGTMRKFIRNNILEVLVDLQD